MISCCPRHAAADRGPAVDHPRRLSVSVRRCGGCQAMSSSCGRRGMIRAALTLIVTLILGMLAVEVDADAQRGVRIPKIGVLQVGTRAGGAHLFEAFKDGMRELGYVEGESVIYEHRSGDNRNERLREAAAELVALKMDVI